ncbi:MAG TPA: phospho-N-acetylmuramoyl-pentapeptide-transferase, partial [Eggerthellaceae bacterium]|nr:phospho-N-acetylmuramoyl-pentapeptide-transferase [Eggerthellaceae bacterium]
MMGDVGSLFLGGLVCAFAYTLDAPWLILSVGVIYVLEFGSDILQIAYVKTHNGKRLFKMAPLHH